MSSPRTRRKKLVLADSGAQRPSPSDALLEVIRPLLDLVGELEPERRTLGAFQNALDLGREAWNLQVKWDDTGALEPELRHASERASREDVSAAEARQVLELLVDRKRKLFPDDDRLLVSAEAVEAEGGKQVKVAWARFARMH